MAPLRSWFSSTQLKYGVLAQMQAHHKDARLGLVEARGHQVDPYGWPDGPDLDALRAAFGIPKSVLALGVDPGGVPENEVGIRYIIDQVRSFLEAVPVDVELSWVPAELAARRLVGDDGVIVLVDDPEVKALLEELAVALRHGQYDALPESAVREKLATWNGEIPRQWQAEGRVDIRVYAHVRALTTALHACGIPGNVHACPMTINASLHHGIVLPMNAGSRDSVQAALLDILRGSGLPGQMSS